MLSWFSVSLVELILVGSGTGSPHCHNNPGLVKWRDGPVAIRRFRPTFFCCHLPAVRRGVHCHRRRPCLNRLPVGATKRRFSSFQPTQHFLRDALPSGASGRSPPGPVANCRDSFGATQFYSGPRVPNLVFYARHAPSGYRDSDTGGDRRAKTERLARECSPSTGSVSPSRWDFRP